MHQFDFFCFWRLRTEPCNLRYQQDFLPHVGTNKQTHKNFSPPIRQSVSYTYRIALSTRPCLLKPPHHTHPHPSTTHVLSALVPTRFHLLLPSQRSNTLGPPETQLQPAPAPKLRHPSREIQLTDHGKLPQSRIKEDVLRCSH